MTDPRISPGTAGIQPTAASGAQPDRARLEEVSREFEAVFLAQMLRGLGAGLEGEGPLGGSGGDPFRDMLADAYARLISRAGGVGVADSVMRELLRSQETR